jgi:hypothetical protein
MSCDEVTVVALHIQSKAVTQRGTPARHLEQRGKLYQLLKCRFPIGESASKDPGYVAAWDRKV